MTDKTMSLQIGKALRELRDAKGLTLKQVAEQLDVIPLTVFNYEHATNHINVDRLKELADFYGMDVEIKFTKKAQ